VRDCVAVDGALVLVVVVVVVVVTAVGVVNTVPTARGRSMGRWCVSQRASNPVEAPPATPPGRRVQQVARRYPKGSA
jgi:hypothetical protein